MQLKLGKYKLYLCKCKLMPNRLKNSTSFIQYCRYAQTTSVKMCFSVNDSWEERNFTLLEVISTHSGLLVVFQVYFSNSGRS